MPAPAQKFVPSPSLVPESERYHARARECRALVGQLRVDFARDHMLKAAAGFERIAREAQEREIERGIAQLGKLVRSLHRAR